MKPFSAETMATLRRALGIKSPMNVWRKQFTELSMWDRLRIEHMADYEFAQGDKWPVGSTINIKKPARYGPR